VGGPMSRFSCFNKGEPKGLLLTRMSLGSLRLSKNTPRSRRANLWVAMSIASWGTEIRSLIDIEVHIFHNPDRYLNVCLCVYDGM